MPHFPVGFNNWMFSLEANSEDLESKNMSFLLMLEPMIYSFHYSLLQTLPVQVTSNFKYQRTVWNATQKHVLLALF